MEDSKRILLLSEHNLVSWQRLFSLGQRPSRLPYGVDQLGRFGFEPQFMREAACALFMMTAYRQRTIYFGDTPLASSFSLAAASRRAELSESPTTQTTRSKSSGGQSVRFRSASLYSRCHVSASK